MPYPPRERKALNMIVSLSTLIQHRMECEASKLPAFVLFFLASSEIYHILALSSNGTLVMEMNRMKTRACGW
jgi:hypothetical protein